MGNYWAELDNNLLIKICERLPSLESYESFGGVCKSWQGAAREGHINRPTFEIPRLMFAAHNKDEGSESDEFISVMSLDIIKKSSLKIFLPEASQKHCISCRDWLLVTSQNIDDVHLLHPLSRVQIPLPKLKPLLFCPIPNFIKKAVLSANPETNYDFIVMIICGINSRCAFYKPGENFWRSIEHTQILDIMYCNNKIYYLNCLCEILTCDIHGSHRTRLLKVFSNPAWVKRDTRRPHNSYFVDHHDEKFLIVRRYLDFPDESVHQTIQFEVFEVNIKDGTSVEIKDLRNKAVFLGANSAYIIECSKFNKCKSNCIYFGEDSRCKDMGIYHLSDGRFQRFSNDIVRSVATPPIWIGPGF